MRQGGERGPGAQHNSFQIAPPFNTTAQCSASWCDLTPPSPAIPLALHCLSRVGPFHVLGDEGPGRLAGHSFFRYNPPSLASPFDLPCSPVPPGVEWPHQQCDGARGSRWWAADIMLSGRIAQVGERRLLCVGERVQRRESPGLHPLLGGKRAEQGSGLGTSKGGGVRSRTHPIGGRGSIPVKASVGAK